MFITLVTINLRKEPSYLHNVILVLLLRTQNVNTSHVTLVFSMYNNSIIIIVSSGWEQWHAEKTLNRQAFDIYARLQV